MATQSNTKRRRRGARRPARARPRELALRGGHDRGGRIGPHDVHDGTLRHARGAEDGAVVVHRQRHAQAVAVSGPDADDVVQEERQRILQVQALAGELRVLLEHVDGGRAVQAHQQVAPRLGHPHRLARRHPAVRDADAHRTVGEDLEGDHGVACAASRPGEDVRLLEAPVVAGAAAEEAVVAARWRA